MTDRNRIPTKAAALLAALSLLLTGCFISPGKFTSDLTLQPGNQFTFTYEGEIHFLDLASLTRLGAEGEEFEAECYDDESFEDRECTEEEIEEQRAEWDANAEQRIKDAEEQAQLMSAMMGGIDPSDPEAAEELRALLLRHKGWNRVEFKENGVYDISYSINGTLSHDFLFPAIEGFPVTNPFVQIILRDDDIVRVNAPGFAAQNEANPMASMFGSLAGMGALLQEDEESPMANMTTIDGTFRVIVDPSMSIRANNTDEGPEETDQAAILTWDISPRTTATPTALVDLTP